jgi:hypothetical protein
MAEDTTLVADGTAQSEIVERSAGGEGPLSAREAAASLADTRQKDAARQRRDDEQHGEAPAAERAGATAETETPPQGDGTAQETDKATGPGETQGDDQAEPSIAPPRSWTKEDKELFNGLPRETQERLAERERSREADFLRRQNEASERLKGLAAQQQETDKARASYEQALPMLLLELQGRHQAEFADIASPADIERLAREDLPRYILWDAQLKKIAGIQQQVVAARARQAQENAARWNAFVQDEDAKFFDKAPEFSDLKVLADATQQASDLLKGLGFTEAELGQLWHGQAMISLRDHRMQLLLRDGVKYREAQQKAKAAQQRSVPHVQRPGPAPARNADADEKVRSLDERLTTSGTLKDAAALLVAQRRARGRG